MAADEQAERGSQTSRSEADVESPFSQDARRWRSPQSNRQAALIGLGGAIVLAVVVAILILTR